MSNFIRHLPCPQCGSKDNLGEYEDHFWCFGCRYHKLKTSTDVLRQRIKRKDTVYTPVEDMTLENELPKEAKQWLYKYGITPDEILKYNFKWNPNMNMLLLLKTKYYWQGRIFGNKNLKYLSKGSKPVTIYGNPKIKNIVLVEDIISATKLARLSPEICASPLLGSTISFEALRWYSKRYDRITIWLDRDKAKAAIKISKLFQQAGKDSNVVITTKDPKEYTKQELKNWLSYK